MAKTLVIKDIFGNTITGSTFPYPTTENQTSQFIRVSFSPAFEAGQTATLPVQVIGNEGTLVSSSSLVFDETHQEFIVQVRGVDDESQDGSDDFTLKLGASTAGNPASYDGTNLNLVIENSDNDGVSNNVASSEPTLLEPAAGADFVAGSAGTAFKWEHAYDADEDELLYHLCFGKTEQMNSMRCVTVGETNIIEDSGVAGASWVSGFLISSLLLGILFIRLQRFTKMRSFGIWLVLFSMGAMGAACGNQSLLDSLNLPTRPRVKTIVPTSNPVFLNSTYTHWRVYADDQKGHVTPSSETRSLVVP